MEDNQKKIPPRFTGSRDDRYMGLAWMWAAMSKDPSTQVGCMIVSLDNRPLGSGYNGPPSRILDGDINWTRPDKYPYIVHAERNALDHCLREPKCATLYVTARPCPDCTLDMIRNDISTCVYFESCIDPQSMTSNPEYWEISKSIAKKGRLNLIPYRGNLNWMRDWIRNLENKDVFR